MTLAQLNCYRTKVLELEGLRAMVRNLRAKAYPGSPAFDAMPHGSDVGDKVGRLAIEIVEAEEKLRVLATAMDAEQRQVELFIAQIREPYTAMIFKLRFLRGYKWSEIWETLGGNGTEDGIKKTCYRYLNLDERGTTDG